MIKSQTSRRQFVAKLASLGASTLIAKTVGAMQNNAPRRIIDVHHHIIPPKFMAEYRKEIAEQGPGLTQVFDWTPKVSLDQMDEAGVATSIVSLNVPGSWFGSIQDGRRVSREVNEYAATLRVDHPGRFGFLATLPLADVDGSLKEIEYAFDTLKADGIGIMTSYDNLPPGMPKFAPIFDELNRRKAVVIMHRRTAACCINLRAVQGNMEFVLDDFRALNSLLTGGTIARCPDLKLIHAHGDKVLPYLSTHLGGGRGGNPTWAPQGVMNEVRKIYIDSAGNSKATMDEMRGIGTLSTRVMFGTDVPYGNVPRNLDALRTQMGLTPAEIRAVEYETAQGLFPKFKA